MRLGFVVLIFLFLPAQGWAEWQVKPFVGVTFGGDTTLLTDLDQQAGRAKGAFGVSTVLSGEVLGIEADVGRTPGFFTGGHLVVSSSVTTVTGNLVVALPRRVARYSLRPYIVGGIGAMRVESSDFVTALPFSTTLATFDVGAGATGFFTNRIGISWDVRYFRSFAGVDNHQGLSVGPEELSFWRGCVALAIRP